MTDSTLDRRLTARILNICKRLSKAGYPRRSQIDPKDFGTDWSNCLMVDLAPVLSQSRFSYVGRGLQDPTWPTFDRQLVAECLEGTLLELLGKQIPQLLAKKKPIAVNGSAYHDNCNVLYRTILVPLSESGKRIDGVLMAITYREVATLEGLPSADSKAGDRAARTASTRGSRQNRALR